MEIVKQAKLDGDFLAWDDFLHEGPVPPHFSLHQLSKIRAYFMDEQHHKQLDKALQSFEDRDRVLEEHQRYNKIILWFEQDIYDQLQLLQILDWLAENRANSTEVTLITTDKYFGEYSHKKLHDLLRNEQTITQKEFQLAKRAWNAFRQPTPVEWSKLLKEETSALPFLNDTIKRVLEEFPNTKNGLSRTAYQALLSIAQGEHHPRSIFIHSQESEERKFMADILFWKILDNFTKYKVITTQKDSDALTITPLGEELLNGKKNWLSLKPINHWIGGVNLSDDNLWCWDIKKRTINHYYYSKPLGYLLPVKHSKI
jgi:hypothetical protein